MAAISVPGSEKFAVPAQVQFDRQWAFRSVFSLASLLVAALSCWFMFVRHGTWFWLPFLLASIGSGIGLAYEAYLVSVGREYQLFGTRGGIRIQVIRATVYGLLMGSMFVWYPALCFGREIGVEWQIAFAGLLTGWLLVYLLFQAPPHNLLAIQVLGFLLQSTCVFFATSLHGGWLAKSLIWFAAVFIFAGAIVGSETPKKSTIFHLMATVGVLLMALGIIWEDDEQLASPFGILMRLMLIGMILVGMTCAFRWLPITWGRCRSLLANWIWPLFYLIVAGGTRLPRPESLGSLYGSDLSKLNPLRLHRYHIAHPRNLTHPIQIPCLDEALTLKVHRFGVLAVLVKTIFAVGSLINRIFPFANIGASIKDKPRMNVWSDGSDYWPWWLMQSVRLPNIGIFKGLGRFQIQSGVKGPGFQKTPDRAIAAYQAGQLLAYLVEFGIAGPFVTVVTKAGKSQLQLDLTFLEQYETKADYEPYGGRAFFEIDSLTKSIKLLSVQPPHRVEEILVDINNPVFRHAEDMILASIYFYVVSGKHLVEIHMGLNLVEVALFNAFDANHRWYHPIRVALYPHLFAHELAEELTTENLLEDKAVFPQIFATTNASLARYLNERFADYQLGQDEEFDRREAALLAGHPGLTLEEVLPNCSLIWEKRYAAIWHEYAIALVSAAYHSDQEVAEDLLVVQFFSELASTFVQPMPNRYASFMTREGLATFISDTIHHLVIRHEVYGTSGVRLALDQRLNKTQVPKDGGPPAVDEWRALACVAMATSRVRYVRLIDGFSNLFADLKDDTIKKAYVYSHDRLIQQLKGLESEFISEQNDDYGILRLLATELDIGAGY